MWLGAFSLPDMAEGSHLTPELSSGLGEKTNLITNWKKEGSGGFHAFGWYSWWETESLGCHVAGPGQVLSSPMAYICGCEWQTTPGFLEQDVGF